MTDSLRKRAITEAPGCMCAGPYSLAAQSGDLIYTSGQIGLDATTGALVEGGFEAETRQVFCNLRAVVEAVGLTFADVLKCNAYLTDVAHFGAFNAIYAAQFEAPFPARTTIGVAQLPLGAQVEVEMVLRASSGDPA